VPWPLRVGSRQGLPGWSTAARTKLARPLGTAGARIPLHSGAMHSVVPIYKFALTDFAHM
jgi:hypothetical protein